MKDDECIKVLVIELDFLGDSDPICEAVKVRVRGGGVENTRGWLPWMSTLLLSSRGFHCVDIEIDWCVCDGPRSRHD